jgi:Group II intron, maturase-specific domain
MTPEIIARIQAQFNLLQERTESKATFAIRAKRRRTCYYGIQPHHVRMGQLIETINPIIRGWGN